MIQVTKDLLFLLNPSLNFFTIAELVEAAKEATHYDAIINVDDPRFLNPENMIEEILAYFELDNLMVPSTPGELAKCIYDNLAVSYQTAIHEIESIFEKSFQTINIIGGGCQNELLNPLIANTTEKQVLVRPVEATAIGNVVAQLMALGDLDD